MQPKFAKTPYIRPIDLLNEARSKNVPGFKRITVRCCYHCHWSKPFSKGWQCELHGIYFGKDDAAGIARMAEFVCDDWEAVRSAGDE